MINVNIVGKRVASVYQVAANLGYRTLPLKYDTGAKYSVISAGMFDDTLTNEGLDRIKDYCEDHSKHKERFVSASGHTFDGYLVTARDVKIGKTHLQEFRYFLVVENQRDIALLGFDFIDNCKGTFEPHSDIEINEFDETSYWEGTAGAMNNDEVIAFIDSLSNE